MSTILKSLKRLEKEKEGVKSGPERPLLTPLGTPQHDMERAVKFAWLRTGLFRFALVALVVAVGAVGLYAYTRPARTHFKIDSQAANTIRQTPIQPRPATAPAAPAVPAPVRPRPQPAAHRPQTRLPAQQVNPPMPPEDEHRPLALRNQLPPLPEEDDSDEAEGPPIGAPIPPVESMQRSMPSGRPGFQGDPAKLKEYVMSQPTHMDPDVVDSSPPAGQMQLPPVGIERSAIPNPQTMPANRRRPASRPGTQAPPRTTQPDSATLPQTAEQENTVFASAERMTDGRLKVQAIVWAEDPAGRMAVVNNRTVREGGTIDNFSVVAIGEDAIYVREDGMRLLKVPFGGP